MKSVLMIAYWFPPEGNAAVYRPLRFLRHLPTHGWRGRVLAAEGGFERYDPDLLRQVPDATEVVRVGAEDLWQRVQRRRAERAVGAVAADSHAAQAPHEPAFREFPLRARARDLVRSVESWWYHPDMQRPWVRPAVRAGRDMCARESPDVLWATGPPWSAFLVAHELSQLAGVPYVLDFREAWTIVPSPFEARRPAWAQRADRRVLGRLLAGARAAVFLYEAEAECFYRLYRGALDPSRIHVIPNGFDGDVALSADVGGERFVLLYTGTLSDYQYDGLLAGLDMLLVDDPSLRRRLCLRFVGEHEPEFAARVRRRGLEDVVTLSAAVPHDEVEQLSRSAHAMLMLERRPSKKGYELLAGAKLFGYLKTGKPILGVVPNGEAERVLRDVGATTLADPGSPSAIAEALGALLEAWEQGRLAQLAPDRTLCEKYSGATQTPHLVRALEGVSPLQPFTPGRFDIVPSLRAEFAAAGLA